MRGGGGVSNPPSSGASAVTDSDQRWSNYRHFQQSPLLWSSLTSITEWAGGNIKSCKLCRWLLNKQLLVTRPCRVQVAMAPVSLWALNFVICWKPSQARLTSAGSGPEEVCPGSGSGHILEIQQESEPTFSLNCADNGPNYTKIHSHRTSALT